MHSTNEQLMNKKLLTVLLLGTFSLLTACVGGGGDDTSTPVNPTPIDPSNQGSKQVFKDACSSIIPKFYIEVSEVEPSNVDVDQNTIITTDSKIKVTLNIAPINKDSGKCRYNEALLASVRYIDNGTNKVIEGEIDQNGVISFSKLKLANNTKYELNVKKSEKYSYTSKDANGIEVKDVSESTIEIVDISYKTPDSN